MDKSMMRFRYTILRRIFVVILAVLLFIPFTAMGVTTNASANTTAPPKITVESKTVHRGQTFELNATLDKNPGLTAMILELAYDKTVMELIGIKRGAALTSHTYTNTNTDTDEGFLVEPFRMLWDGTAQDKTTGVLVTFTFESKITAELDDYPVTLTCEAKNTTSEYGKPIAVDIDNGVVTLIKGEYTVVYKNYDGTVLQEKDYNEDDIPSYDGATPTRAEDAEYSYTFNQTWKGAVSNVEGVIWYIAQYDKTPQEYQVIFYVEGLDSDDPRYAFARYDYGEEVDLSNVPERQNHTFSGWYADENYTQEVTFQRMPAHDLALYGYMKYNVREEEMPQITLSVDKIEEGVAFVNVDVTKNPGVAGLVLTLDHDKSALEFIGFEQGEAFGAKQFYTTNTENGYDVEPFKFYWEHAENAYETGTILTLKFKIDESKPAGLYGVTVTYDERADATYKTDMDELWYTKLEIIGTSVPIGLLYHWYEETEDGSGIDVTTEEGQSPETALEVKKITNKISLPSESVIAAAGEDMEMKDVYSVRLLQGGVEVEPNGKITVKIELTEAQKKCTTIMVFHLDNDGKLTVYESKTESGYVVFETERLSNWAIVGNVVAGVGGTTQTPTNTPILIVASILLAIATMGFALVILARTKKKERVFVYPEDE